MIELGVGLNANTFMQDGSFSEWALPFMILVFPPKTTIQQQTGGYHPGRDALETPQTGTPTVSGPGKWKERNCTWLSLCEEEKRKNK